MSNVGKGLELGFMVLNLIGNVNEVNEANKSLGIDKDTFKAKALRYAYLNGLEDLDRHAGSFKQEVSRANLYIASVNKPTLKGYNTWITKHKVRTPKRKEKLSFLASLTQLLK